MDLRDWLRDNGVVRDAGSGEWVWRGDRYTWSVPDAVLAGLDANSALFVTGELEKWKMADAGYCASCGKRAGAGLDDLALCGACSAEFNTTPGDDGAAGAPVPAPEPGPGPESAAELEGAPRIAAPDQSPVP